MTTNVFPMQWTWRGMLIALGVLGVVALVLAALELSGIVERGLLLKDAGDGERWAAAAVGAALLPFVITTLKNARLTIDGTAITTLRLGILSRSETLPFAEIKRWGTGQETNRGYRHRMLLFERHDRTKRSIKLQMFSHQNALLRALEERLGPPAEVESRIGGVRFAED